MWIEVSEFRLSSSAKVYKLEELKNGWSGIVINLKVIIFQIIIFQEWVVSLYSSIQETKHKRSWRRRRSILRSRHSLKLESNVWQILCALLERISRRKQPLLESNLKSGKGGCRNQGGKVYEKRNGCKWFSLWKIIKLTLFHLSLNLLASRRPLKVFWSKRMLRNDWKRSWGFWCSFLCLTILCCLFTTCGKKRLDLLLCFLF